MNKPKMQYTSKQYILFGFVYIIIGVLGSIFRFRIEEALGLQATFIFIASMVLILWGIKDVAIMPLLTKDTAKKDNKKGK